MFLSETNACRLLLYILRINGGSVHVLIARNENVSGNAIFKRRICTSIEEQLRWCKMNSKRHVYSYCFVWTAFNFTGMFLINNYCAIELRLIAVLFHPKSIASRFFFCFQQNWCTFEKKLFFTEFLEIIFQTDRKILFLFFSRLKYFDRLSSEFLSAFSTYF